MKITRISIYIIVLLFVNSLAAQQIESSILKASKASSNFHLSVDQNGRSAIFDYSTISVRNDFSFYAFNQYSNPIFSKKITKEGFTFQVLGRSAQSFSDDLIVVATHSSPIFVDDGVENFDLLIYDIPQDKHIALGQDSPGKPSEIYIDSEKILVLRNHDAFTKMFAIDRAGNELWSKSFEFFEDGVLLDQFSFITYSKFASIQFSTDGFFIIAFTLTNDRTLLLKISENGEQLSSKILEECSLLNVEIDDINKTIYYSGLSRRTDFQSEGFEKGILLKTDFDLNVQQTNLIYADHYPFLDLNLNLVEDEILLSSTSFNKVPLIYATLNTNFEVIDEYGYNIRTTRFRRGHYFSDSNIRFLVSDDDGYPVVFKSNFKGEIDDCEILEACLSSDEIVLVEKSTEIVINETPGLIETNLTLENTTEQFGSHSCPNMPALNPDFDFPDTLCIGECATTLNINTGLAETQKWQLKGPALDETFVDQESLSHCFEAAGDYTLTQSISSLGCEHTFSRDIVVLSDDLSAQLSGAYICELPPYEISLNNDNRNIKSAVWNTGESGLQITINQGGYYEATVTDGFCEDIVGANFDFLTDLIGNQEIIELPADSLVCIQNLPYVINLENRFNSTFKLNGREAKDDVVTLYREGKYTISTEIEDCFFEKEYILKVDSCLSRIYMPTAFSPNGDGINDTFEPLGSHFELIDLTIYDRWGAIIHEGSEPWGGQHRGKNIQSDIYFYILSYHNTLADLDEIVKGSFTLMK